jgi:hypothetical protein
MPTRFGPDNMLELFDAAGNKASVALQNGILAVSTPAGAAFAALGGASGDEGDMFKQRAQAFLPPGFSTLFHDFYGATYDILVASAVTSTVSAVAGRNGAAKKRVVTSGAGGFYADQFVNAAPSTTLATIVADLCTDYYYVGSGSIINVAPTGNAEIGLCGLYNIVTPIAATDAASGQYVSLGVSLAVSATKLVVRRWDGAALLTYVTAIPIEVGVYRRWELCNDGMGTIWLLRDGVIMDSITDLNFMTFISHINAGLSVYQRANGGTTDWTWDWIGSAAGRT